MVNDIFKILIDEPEKIQKAVLRGVKVLLAGLLGAWLYKLIIGRFHLIPWNDFNEMAGYFSSGRVLICLLLYFIADYLIIPFLSYPGYGLALLFSNVKGITSKRDIRTVLSISGILDFKDDEKNPLPGRNIDLLLNLSREFENEKSRNKIDSLKQTFISDILNLYSAFVVLYFLLLKSPVRVLAMDIIIIVVLVLICVFYAIIHGIAEYLEQHYEEIIQGLSFVKFQALVMNTFATYRIFPQKPPEEYRLNKCKLFPLGRIEYILCPVLCDKRMIRAERDFVQILNKHKTDNRIFIIIVQHGLLTNEFLLEYGPLAECLLLEFSSEEDLRIKLRKQIETLPLGLE